MDNKTILVLGAIGLVGWILYRRYACTCSGTAATPSSGAIVSGSDAAGAGTFSLRSCLG